MKLTKLLLAGVLLVGMTACSQKTEDETLDEVDQAELAEEVDPVEEEEIDAETDQGDTYAGTVGDTLTFDNVSITLESVSYTAETDTEEMVTCQFSLSNNSGADVIFNADYFAMEDSDSNTVKPVEAELDGESIETLSEHAVKPDSEVKGSVSFVEPTGTTPLILTWLKNGDSTVEHPLTWTITRD